MGLLGRSVSLLASSSYFIECMKNKYISPFGIWDFTFLRSGKSQSRMRFYTLQDEKDSKLEIQHACNF